MIDPPTPLERVYAEGDEDVLPTPTGGDWGMEPVTDYHSVPNKEEDTEPKIWRPFQGTLASGSEATFTVSDRPDYWIVLQRDTANSLLYIWPYEVPSGAASEIGPAGHAKVPGLSYSITIRAAGAAASTYNVIAVRGYDMADVSW